MNEVDIKKSQIEILKELRESIVDGTTKQQILSMISNRVNDLEQSIYKPTGSNNGKN